MKAVKRKGAAIARTCFALGLVFAGFLALTELVARLAWLMPEAGAVPKDAVAMSVQPPWTPPQGRGVHRVEEWPTDKARAFREAPVLAARVRSDSLPPVEKRLPENPLVVVPPQQCGPYGGTWQRLATSPVDVANSINRLFNDGLIRYGPLGDPILPNLAERWSVDDGGRSFTFWLRKGVRWSDGAPFTVDDIAFWYEDFLQNPDLTPTLPSYFMRGGELMKLDKIDKYTFRVRFKEPYGLFIPLLAGRYGDMITCPAHYLKQFLPKYASEEKLNAQARAEHMDFWYQLFTRKKEWSNPELPQLTAWVIKSPPPARPVVWERNPYYWKVDPEGNQLPYIDRIAADIYDAETINLKAINGEVGFQGRHLAFNNYPLFMENRKSGGYQVRRWIDGGDNMNALCINMNHKDPVLREIVQDRRFRVALSLAINRSELNKVCYFGLGKARQICPPAASPFYWAEYEEAFTQFDPAEANRLLDEMGLDKRGPDGVRLRPDARPLHLTIEISSAMLYPLLIQLVAEHWSEVGVATDMKLLARELVMRRLEALQHDVTVWTGAGEYQPLLDPRYFFPHNIGSYYAYDYMRWYTSGGKRGQKPLPDMLRCMDIFARIEATTDQAEQVALFKEIQQIDKENLWVIGMVGELPALYIVKNTFRNVPEVAVSTFVFRSPGNVATECFAIEDSAKTLALAGKGP